jgi:hypothetical protein
LLNWRRRGLRRRQSYSPLGRGQGVYDVFLSYNRQDQEAVERVAKALRDRGLRVYLDRWYLISGRSWIDELERILADCRSIAIFIGPSGIGRWQQREKDLALDRQANDRTFPVIPVLLPGGDPALGFLKLNTWVDLRGGYTADLLEILVCGVRGEPPGDNLKARAAETVASVCPYRGLLPFREEDEAFFCGRQAFTDKLRGCCCDAQFRRGGRRFRQRQIIGRTRRTHSAIAPQHRSKHARPSRVGHGDHHAGRSPHSSDR